MNLEECIHAYGQFLNLKNTEEVIVCPHLGFICAGLYKWGPGFLCCLSFINGRQKQIRSTSKHLTNQNSWICVLNWTSILKARSISYCSPESLSLTSGITLLFYALCMMWPTLFVTECPEYLFYIQWSDSRITFIRPDYTGRVKCSFKECISGSLLFSSKTFLFSF